MNSKPIVLLITILTIFLFLSGTVAAAPATNEIWSLDDLKNIGNENYNEDWTMDANYKLMTDLRIDEDTWNSIGNFSEPFTGIFDGSNYSITFSSDMTFLNSDSSWFGLFGIVGGEIKNTNLIVSGNLTTGGDIFGPLAGTVYGNIFNCSVSGDKKIVGNSNVGGLVGFLSDGLIENCSVSGGLEIISNEKTAGGLLGELGDNGCVINSTVRGDSLSISSTTGSGGFVGSLHEGIVNNCSVSGDVNVTASGNNSGGFAGHARIGEIINSSVVGDSVSVKAGNFSGGFVGYAYPSDVGSGSTETIKIADCYSSGSLSVTANIYYAGGFIGGFQNSNTDTITLIENCSVRDVENIQIKTINSSKGDSAGGFAGLINGGIIDNCSVISRGSFNVDSYFTSGGFAGRIKGDGIINNSFVSGNIDINSSNYSGGLVGSVEKSTGLLNNSYVSGSVQIRSNSSAGGLVGQTLGPISGSFVETGVSVISSEKRAGGIAGTAVNVIENCFSEATVTSPTSSGGLVGHGNKSTQILTSYFAGAVSLSGSESDAKIGGIIGSWTTGDIPRVTDCIYLNSSGSGFTNEYGESVSSVDMMKIKTYQEGSKYLDDDSAGWDITSSSDLSSTWYINEDKNYPTLQYISPSNNNGSSGGSGTGKATVVDSGADQKDVSGDSSSGISGTGGDDSKSSAANTPQSGEEGYASETGSSKTTLYLILCIGLVAIIGIGLIIAGKNGLIKFK